MKAIESDQAVDYIENNRVVRSSYKRTPSNPEGVYQGARYWIGKIEKVITPRTKREVSLDEILDTLPTVVF